MARTLFKIGGRYGAKSLTFQDDSGTLRQLVDGTQPSAITALTDSTTGTANDTVADVGAAFSQATLNNNFADVTAKINAIIARLQTVGIIP